MSEVKRAQLISFASEKVNNKKPKEIKKTVRLSVNLPESTEDKCPEFNYKDLFTAAKKRDVQKTLPAKQPNGLDPFNDDDDDDVKRIAAEMEAKYGIGVAKKRKWRKDDYADIGMGYDETDSFIDNTDGYDEIIPRNVTTLHGGFYINCGALEFKTDENASSEESSSSEEDTPEKSSNNRKRVIESSAESEEETQTEKTSQEKHIEKKQKLVTSTNGMQKAIKKRLFSHEKIKQQIRKKQQRADETKKTVRELLRERREDLNMSIPPTDLDSPEKIEPASSPKDKKPQPLASVDDVIESVINSVTKKKEDHHTDESSKDSVVSSKDGVCNNKSVVNSSEAESNDDIQIKPIDIVQLPENLPSDIIEIIESIKKAALCSTEGKVKFFQGEVNTMLLNLERKCRCLGKQSRMRVYEHLAPFVKCRKETLIKRAKNLCAVEEQKKIKILLDRLKAAVSVIMPSLIANYEAECKGILQRKFSLQNDEGSKNLRMPKRQFLWNDDTRKLVKDIITLRKKCFLNEGKQKESLEKHLTEFIKSEVHTLWPDGWMSMNSLLKYCSFTPEIKKNVDNNTKKPTPTVPPPPPPPSDISISPSSNIIPTTPSISISSTSSLTITPVTTNVHKVSNNEIKTKPKLVNLNETIISKVTSDNNCSVSKPSKPLPAVDIVKTTPPDINNVKYPTATCISNSSRDSKTLYLKNELEAILIEESPVKKEEPENLSSTHINVIKHEGTENSNNHCQIIDLTDHSDIKKKTSLKPKPKYTFEFPEKPPKPKKDTSEHIRVKSKDEITATSALNQIIADTLNDANRFAQTPKTLNSTVNSSNNTASVNNPSESVVKKSSASSYDYLSKSKATSEGDDIQKVMEGLKVLHKMSSPVKTNDEIKRSSPVSVIAFNKSYTHDSSSSSTPSHTTSAAPHRTTSFQDAFQKQFIPDYHLMRASQATTPPKGSHNSISKHNHMSTKVTTSSDRYLQNSNNNYAQPNSNKLKNNCSSQQSANSKSSSQHK